MYRLILVLLFIFPTSIYHGLEAVAAEPVNLTLSLTQAIETAVSNHASIKAAGENLKSAIFESQSARADMLPKVTASYAYTNLGSTPFQVMNMGPAGKTEAPVAHSDQYH
jgi:outer membrane protein TolC